MPELPTDQDPHEEVHQILDIRFAGIGGWAVAFRKNADGTHGEYRLIRGEDVGERLSCFQGDPAPELWGVPPSTVLDMLAHVVWHATTGTPPGACGEASDG